MKHYISLLCTILSISIITSCQEEIIQVEEETQIELNNYDYLSIIKDLGYSIENVIDLDSAYLVSNTVLLKKEYLKEISYSTPQTKLQSNITLPKEQQHIFLNIQLFDGIDLNMLNNAIEQWNNVNNCNIIFTPSYYDLFPDISHQFAYANICISANPSPIYSNATKYSYIVVEPMKPGNKVSGKLTIDTDHKQWLNLEHNQQIMAIMHSLGLLIGLKPNDEHLSIMRDASKNNDKFSYWQGFSERDLSFLANYYPLIPTHAEFTNTYPVYTTNCNYSLDFKYKAIKEIVNESYIFSVVKSVNNSNPIVSNDKSTLTLKFEYPGTYTIKTIIQGFGGSIHGEYYQDFKVVSKNVTLPSDIAINTPFNISVEISESPNVFSDVDFKFVKEKHFDGTNPQNVDITKINEHTAQVILKDYGHYIIDAHVKGSSNIFRFHIEEYLPFTTPMFNPYQIVFRTITDTLKVKRDTVIDCRPIPITLQKNSQTIDKRIVLLKYSEYYCQTTSMINTRRVDRRYCYGPIDTLKYNTNHPSDILVPANTYESIDYYRSPSDPLAQERPYITNPDNQYIDGWIKYRTVSTERFCLYSPNSTFYIQRLS